MTIQDIGAIGEVLGAIGVIVTLLYLARQIRQSSHSIQGQTYDSIVRSLNEMNQFGINDREILSTSVRAVSGEKLSMEDDLRYTAFLLNLFRIVETAYHQHALGLVEKSDLYPIIDSTRVHLASSYGKRLWDSRRELHRPELQQFIDEVISQTDTTAIMKSYGIESSTKENT